jgi:SAM-dependent methyltransferase
MMQISVYRRKTCRLCDSKNVEMVVSLAPTPVAEKYVTKEQAGQAQESYPMDLYMCRDCSHVQILDVVDPKFVFDSYTYSSSNTSGIVKHFEECADKIVGRYKPAPKALVVDIGSNDGGFLRCFQSRGLRVLGVDPAKEIAQKATKSGIETLAEFLSLDLARKLKKERGPASVVTAFNVFAHADDLGGMADSIRELLAPDGVFVFEVSYLLDVIDRMLLGTIFHEHLSYHSIKPMRDFLRRHGMELIDVERVTIQGGSFIGTAQLIGGPHAVSSTVGELLELEKNRGLEKPETVKGFATRLKQVKDELGGMLINFKRQGKTIAGYGAARSGTTLISQMDLGNVLSFIVDDSAEKQNKLSPGHHIPVLPTKAMYERRPDYVFILAWIHAKKIIENNKQYVEQGGHFVVCFPEIKVIGKEQLGTVGAK